METSHHQLDVLRSRSRPRSEMYPSYGAYNGCVGTIHTAAIGLDLAKNWFHVHAIDARCQAVAPRKAAIGRVA